MLQDEVKYKNCALDGAISVVIFVYQVKNMEHHAP